MSNIKCTKCGKRFPTTSITQVTPSSGKAWKICPRCYDIWEKIYHKWKKRRCDNYWDKGWHEFQRGRIKRRFNPSLRDKYESIDSIRPSF